MVQSHAPEAPSKLSTEVGINHCTPAIRLLLTRGTTQNRIREETGAVVTTRGTYIPPNAPPCTVLFDHTSDSYVFLTHSRA